MSGHDSPHITIILATFIVYLVSSVATVVFMTPIGTSRGIANNDTRTIWVKYSMDITPTSATLTLVVTAALIWQGAWMIFALTTICKMFDNSYLYRNPPLISGKTYFLFSLGVIFSVSWLVFWGNEMLELGLASLSFTTLFLAMAAGSGQFSMYKKAGELFKAGKVTEVVLVGVLVNNCIAFYASWMGISCVLAFCIVLHYRCNVDQELASTVGLSLYLFGLLLWFLADVFYISRFIPFILPPYLMIITVQIGVIVNTFNPQKRNSIFSVCLVCVGFLLLILKLISSAVIFSKNKNKLKRDKQNDEEQNKDGAHDIRSSQPDNET